MNTTIKRIDPRRPFVITAAGLKRITLGAEHVAGASYDHALQAGAHGHAAAKTLRTTQTPQHTLLVVAHSDRGGLDDHTRQALAAAALIADATTQVALLVLGELKDDAAALGADKVIELPSFDRRTFAPEREVQAVAACVAQLAPAHIFMPDNATGDGDLGRRYAALAGASIATHVVQIDGKEVSTYAQAKKAYATRALPDVILLAAGAVDTRLPFVGAGERLDVPALAQLNEASTGAYRDLGIEEIDAAQVALEEADFIVSAGNGVTDVAAFEKLASTFGAAIGASRVAVDNGMFTRDKQIGATGKTVEASVYIAFGISGAVQHLQGIKDCRHVIAVNLDGSAPIVKRANLTIIGDTQATIASLIDEIDRARSGRGAAATPLAHTIVEGVAA
ncbi:electron transfer flavoprotein subunit alpha/FixB family protein [Paraburkholderia sabiae]|uniref:Electron transfer flavoprotein subunit alpha/FixB family protein n=1 Tax=Paraburkholderia sabiae TaxID=273251 RepID=A0ABU9QC12_9BURK|nr:electron transfer flavoprotein subunit alpha/FixB family protein [Paraburkholderia sabiae]WJZ75792.1 electron transfer flavoprotein subunit alpha/FixB family protein [Paraburkholderia sabiae]CAD6561461.1 Protein FixB [Paraburkholderia sabiae]CAG9220399.1 Electron transfer flavoprotein, alpha subunit [Paraburkholderia sabiae]